MHKNAIVAVVVTFHPNEEELTPLFLRLSSQTHSLVIVDNTPTPATFNIEHFIKKLGIMDRCTLLSPGENLGIGKAINIGCQKAFELGAEFVLLSDQDSIPDNDMVKNLLVAFDILSAEGENVAAIGPTYRDIYTNQTIPFQTYIKGRAFYSKTFPSKDHPFVETLSIITSGSLISQRVFSTVGPMREDLFIDYIDTEWSQRARYKGYKVFGTGTATMQQRLGNNSMKVWYLKWRQESQYNPDRIYYRIRNYIALIKLKHIDFRWKLRSAWYNAGVIYSHSLFGNARVKCFSMACRGIWDGLWGKLGRI